jgi:hypothetical protein
MFNKVAFVGLHYMIILQCMSQKKKKTASWPEAKTTPQKRSIFSNSFVMDRKCVIWSYKSNC